MTTELGATLGATPHLRRHVAPSASNREEAVDRRRHRRVLTPEHELLLVAQWRLLEAAADPSRPAVDRLRALVSVSTNLDRTFVSLGAAAPGPNPAAVDAAGSGVMAGAVRREAQRLARGLRDCLRDRLIPVLLGEGLDLRSQGQLEPWQRQAARRLFEEEVFPILTPLALDPGRPFRQASNQSLNLAVLVREGSRERFARVKVPQSLPRLIQLDRAPGAPLAPGAGALMWLEELIAAQVDRLFPGLEVVGVHQFHVLRAEPEQPRPLPVAGVRPGAARQAQLGPVVRLIVSPGTPASVTKVLMDGLQASPLDVQRLEGPLAGSAIEALLEEAACRVDEPP